MRKPYRLRVFGKRFRLTPHNRAGSRPTARPLHAVLPRVTDYERTVAAFDVISDLAEKNNAQVWPAHDSAWFSTMTLASEGYYA